MTKARVRKTMERWLYVILLDPAVARNKRFRQDNPDYDGKAVCYYVGSSAKDPETRFAEHVRGHKSAKVVRQFGKKVVHPRCRRMQVLSTGSIEAKERRYAARLRAEGFGVYQG